MFRPDVVPPDNIIATFKDRLKDKALGSVLVTGRDRKGNPVIPFDVAGTWVTDDPGAAFAPVLFLTAPGFTGTQVEAMAGSLSLTTSVAQAQATWVTPRVARSVRRRSWPTPAFHFSAVKVGVPPRPGGVGDLGASLWSEADFDFYFARSSRHGWMPLEAHWDAVSDAAAGGTADAHDLATDVALDGSNHKQLNVYAVTDSAPSGTLPFPLNADSLGLPVGDEPPPKGLRRQEGAGPLLPLLAPGGSRRRALADLRRATPEARPGEPRAEAVRPALPELAKGAAQGAREVDGTRSSGRAALAVRGVRAPLRDATHRRNGRRRLPPCIASR